MIKFDPTRDTVATLKQMIRERIKVWANFYISIGEKMIIRGENQESTPIQDLQEIREGVTLKVKMTINRY